MMFQPRSIFVLSLCLLFYARLPGADMILKNMGQKYILHDDNTWDFEDKNIQDMTQDQIIALDDNRLIKLSTDYTWKFVDKAEIKKSEDAAVKLITGRGTADHVVHSEANAIALKKALENATVKLRASIKSRKLNYDKLHDCVKRVEKETDCSESFTKGKGWRVETVVTLDQGSILAVLDCEAEKAPPPSTGAEAGAQ